MYRTVAFFALLAAASCSPPVSEDDTTRSAPSPFALVSASSVSGTEVFILRHQHGGCLVVTDGAYSGAVAVVPDSMCRGVN